MSALPTRGSGLQSTDRPLATAPNGLYAGPQDEPDRYELLGEAVAGGEGVTWRGRYHGRLTAPVALAVKALTPPTDEGQWPDPADVARWNDHRHLLQTLRNDHLVRVYDIFLGPAPHPGGTACGEDVPYVVMEWIEGPTLDDALRGAPGRLPERLAYVRDIADAVAALHSTNATSGNPLLHRDIKPENCIVDVDRGAVLVDIGTVRTLADGYDPRGVHSRQYAAPEVLDDLHAPRSTASDLYGLGAVAYFCVTGADPPAADRPGAAETIRSGLRAAVRVSGVRRAGAVTSHLAAMLDPDPAARPGSPLAWAEQLVTMTAPRRRRTALCAALLAGLVLAGDVASARPPAPAAPAVVATRPAAVGPFVPFGASFTSFPTTADGGLLRIGPPTGPDRYEHLWGLHAPGQNCVSTVEFDAHVLDPDPTVGYGFAVAPRSAIEADQPVGYSLQYEWHPADFDGGAGSFVRPVELPGGAWRWSEPPVAAADLTAAHHVVVSATGTLMTITIDGRSVGYEVPDVECGGVSIRAWGAPVEFRGVGVRGS